MVWLEALGEFEKQNSVTLSGTEPMTFKLAE
jgi:hypothetical protein